MTEPIKKVLITDLDNTLFDWVGLWFACFEPMMRKISDISGISVEQLKPYIKAVHEKHGTSEYSFLLEELQPVIAPTKNADEVLKTFEPAIQAFRKNRRKYLELYPTVADTLLRIRGRGTRLIGYTESMGFYSNYRIRRLGLDGVLHEIFSPQDHDTPKNMSESQQRKYPAQHYELKFTKHSFTPRGSLKPDPDVLREIVRTVGAEPNDCVYIGDSLPKDVRMAQSAGVIDVFAEYGDAKGTPGYDLLKEVTHWTTEDVARELELKKHHVNPAYTLHKDFSDILDIFRFGDSENGK